MRILFTCGLTSLLYMVVVDPRTVAAQAQPEVVDMTESGVQQDVETATEAGAEPAASLPPAPAAAPAAATSAVAPESPDSPAPAPEPYLATVPDPAAQHVPVLERRNALSLSLLGFIGRFRLTYERMLAERHGVFGEALFSPGAITGFDFIGYGASAGYRFHWRGPIHGPFVGGLLQVEYGSGKQKVRPDFREEDEFLYRGSGVLLTVAIHAGYRWLLGRGFTIALRGGLGFAYSWVNPKPSSEQEATDALAGAGPGIDGEASLGWAF